MMQHTGTIRLALAFAALLGGLTTVIYRQSRALEVLRATEELRGARVIAEAERGELVRRIQTLESRAHVVAVARERLGMHVPSAEEIVILPLAGSQSEPPSRSSVAVLP
ncbi:MAG: hypothetical protein ACT443_12900 [Gemmatimonadota bacterium]